MGFTVVVISAIGSLLYLDRVALGRWMISRPIVVGPLIGGLYGETQMGLLIGIVLEAVWLNRLPVGSTIPPDDSFAAILAIGSWIILKQHLELQGTGMVALTVFLALPGTRVGAVLDGMVRRWNTRVAHFQREELEKGQIRIVTGIHWLGMLNFYLVFFLGLSIFLALEVLLALAIRPWLSEPIMSALRGTFRCLPLLAVASILTLNRERRSWAFWLGGYLLISGVLWVVQRP